MRRQRKGFTLIEVSLFLAITGVLFLSVTIGVQNSIYQQRYSDVVQSFADFMRGVYDEVLNVQSLSDGRHGRAIYGKLVTFGETTDKQTVYVYDVIAQAVGSGDLGGGTTLGLLKQLGANVVFREADDQPYKPVGIISEYSPNWGARIQPTNSYTDFKGSILIVRDPKSGTVRTFTKDDVIKVKERVETNNNPAGILTTILDSSNFRVDRDLDFCINPKGNAEDHTRTDIRISAGANNSSSVEIVGRDDNSENGNKCNR